MIRIVLVDDHPIVRRGLVDILSDFEDLEIVGEAGDADEALRLVRSTPCDLALVDISLPGRSGLDLLRDFHAECPGLPVLMLSTYPADQYARRALQSGASGYLNKDAPPDMLVEAIRRVAEGGRFVTPEVAELLVGDLGRPDGIRDHQALSTREFEVLRLLGRGKTVSDIAEELHLSVKTVSTYRTRIMEKLGLDTTAAMIRYAVDNGLVD